jgi:Tfp pilus assembly protein PilP
MEMSKMRILFAVIISFLIAEAVIADGIVHRNPFSKPLQLRWQGDDLTTCPLKTLRLKGTIDRNGEALAIVSDIKNHLYYLKLNDIIGLEKAKVVLISSEAIQVEWISQGEKLTDHLVL